MTKREIFKLVLETETTFINELKVSLGLEEIKGPYYLEKSTGLNDDLSENETPLDFEYKGVDMEIVQSLAKWKRLALKQYDYKEGEGIVIRMNAIRKDENIESKYHSLHVDQYDWEKVISKHDRTIDFLKTHVKKIYSSLLKTKSHLKSFITLKYDLPNHITFITSQELLEKYPNLKPHEREMEFVKEKKAVFVIGVGEKLSDGLKQGERAPDYDDWTLNGDLIMYDHVNDDILELSSMGIRVNKERMEYQHKQMNATSKLNLPFHNSILKEELPESIGGGIGVSRINMFILELADIKNVK